jgi:hypothetical protein
VLLGAIGIALASAVVLVLWWRGQREVELEVMEDAVEVSEKDCLEDNEAASEEAGEAEPEPPSLISFPCTGCGRTLTVQPALAGRKGKCRRCGEQVRAPGIATVADGERAKTSEATPVPNNRPGR